MPDIVSQVSLFYILWMLWGYSRVSNKHEGGNNHADGKFSRINERAECNMAVLVGIFQKPVEKQS